MKSRRLLLLCSVAAGGFAALGWETIWQINTALAIGVSSQATALVISATMGGMAIGTWLTGLYLQRRPDRHNPLLLYALIELFIGLCGFFVQWEFDLAARLDAAAFAASGSTASLVHLLLIACTLGPPSMAMGASIPVLGLVARQTQSSLGLLYGLNTLGAAAGTLLMAFVVLPNTGISLAAGGLAAVNVLAASTLFALARSSQTASAEASAETPAAATATGVGYAWLLLSFLSGFSIFALEVAAFRAMRAAFFSTSYSFAVMLGSVLLSLSVGAYAARLLRKDRATACSVLAIGGALLLGVTPMIERLDALTSYRAINMHLSHFLLALSVIGPLVVVLGIVFPLLLDASKSPLEWGLLHGSNTVGAILGAIVTAWVLLPALGLAPTLWLVGALLVAAGALAAEGLQTQLRWAGVGAAALALAYIGQSGIGKTRIVGQLGKLNVASGVEVVAYRETPDFTVSVVESGGKRMLYIDGFNASDDTQSAYMEWMGRLPMLLHPDPRDALVICFGRGETSDAVRAEGAQSLDIVDISAAVFEMGSLFPANNAVLTDPRVRPIVMDGRSWMRRTTKQYDVITLEPMPPTFAGMNDLYSREFYQLAHERLRDGGTIAQWVPYHLISPDQAEAISRTFADVFPDSMVWLYPAYRTGILLGRKAPKPAPIEWPGLERTAPGRELTPAQVRGAVSLDAAALARYASPRGILITDDNQYLAYGFDTRRQSFELTGGVEYEKVSLQRIAEAQRGP